MNDLARYIAIRDRMLPGDVLLFDGSDNADLIELVEHVLPNGIETLTRSNWSHLAVVNDRDTLIESTILNGKNGPQINDTMVRLAEYDGCNVSWFPWLAFAHARMDMTSALQWARSRVGVDKYSKRAYGHFLARLVGLQHIFPHFSKSHPGEEVCSEFGAMIFQRAGVEKLIGPVNPNECSPETIARWPVLGTPVQLIGGQTKAATGSK